MDNGVYAKHKNRPWDCRNNYRIVRGGVSRMRRVQSATTTGTFMRILDNCTHESMLLSISNEIYGMQSGVRMSAPVYKWKHGTVPLPSTEMEFTDTFSNILTMRKSYVIFIHSMCMLKPPYEPQILKRLCCYYKSHHYTTGSAV